MAEHIVHEQNLPDTFKEIWSLLEIIDKTQESTSSDKVQGYVYHACEMCKKAITMVNKLNVFSDNETIEEVATNEIKYMLLPALMGYFLMKNSVRDRLRVIQESKNFYTDFLKMCKNYHLTSHEVQDPPPPPQSEDQTGPKSSQTGKPSISAPDIRAQACMRNNKIQRFKEQKELEKKINELRDTVEQEHVDDEVKRDYYLMLLKRFVNICIDELDSIKDEIAILEMMASHKKNKTTESHKKEDHKVPPLQPFIITKDSLQKQVYGLGYPGIPTVTIEEFFEKKVEEGTLHKHCGGHSMEEWAKNPEKDKVQREIEETEKEEKIEKEDPDELKRARDWDEYKDEHRTGWGNRQNRH